MSTLPFSLNLILIVFFFVFLSGITFAIVGIFFNKGKNDKNNFVFHRNIFINIGLIVFSGILFLLYEKLFNKIYSETYPSIFLGIIVMLGIFFTNFLGIFSSIIYSKKLFLTLIIYGLFIVSTAIIYNLMNIIINLLENKKIIGEHSGFFIYYAIFIIVENIIAYLIAKNITKRNNRIPHHFA